MNRLRPAALLLLCLLAAGCTAIDVRRLAGDDSNGRQNDTPGSTLARNYLKQELSSIADPLNGASYEQTFTSGTNVLGVIRGTALPNKYVIVGAHYDGLGNSCRVTTPGDTICNGATDNATGAAAALSIARTLAREGTRRSVIIAFWDREEDGLLGSQFYTQNPLVPLADTVAYVNFDIQGANLLPSLRNTTFAIAAETGGSRLTDIVRSSAGEATLDTTLFSSIFGQGRSDYQRFINVNVPTVFYSDSTGPCYHTVDDEPRIVDFGKLDQQIVSSLAATRQLANTTNPPSFVSGQPSATYDDLLGFAAAIERGYRDRGRFSQADQDTLTRIRGEIRALVADGREAFDADDVGTLLGDAVTVVNLLTRGQCESFVPPTND